MGLMSFGLRKLTFFAVGVVSVLSALSLIGFVWARVQTESYSVQEDEMRLAIESLATLDHAGLAINLAAMDAIVDAGSQQVNQELIDEVSELKKSGDEALAFLGKLSAFPDLVQAVPNYEKQFKSIAATAVQIFEAIGTRKATPEMLGALDDQIDAQRSEFSDELVKKSRETSTLVQTRKMGYNSSLQNMFYLNIFALVSTILAVVFLSGRTALSGTKRILFGLSRLDTARARLERGARELEAKASRLSRTVNEQSSGVTQTIAAVTQIQSIIKRNNENLSRASRNLAESSQASASGLKNSVDLDAALQRLSQTSQELQEILAIVSKVANKTETINNIVFKTQVLAFNASIEAARAGDHGKGFSVVAQEVGRLADLSGVASAEINQLLEDSKTQVSQILSNVSTHLDETVRVSNIVKTNFEGLAHRVTSIADSVLDVETGAKEQELGLEQCSKAMQSMNSATAEVANVAVSMVDQCSQIRESNHAIAEVDKELKLLVRGQNAGFVSNVGTDSQSFVAENHSGVPPTASVTAQVNSERSSDASSQSGVPETGNEDAKAIQLLNKLRKNSDQSQAS